jgi:hypothetical protein
MCDGVVLQHLPVRLDPCDIAGTEAHSSVAASSSARRRERRRAGRTFAVSRHAVQGVGGNGTELNGRSVEDVLAM